MPVDNVIAVAVVMFLVGLFILFLLWPNEKQGARLLRKWGVAEPAGPDVAEAVKYLRRRRFWYPWLYLVIPLLPHTAKSDSSPGLLFVTLLLGALLAELFAQRPSRGVRREAVLVPRGILDFVPVWAIVLSGVAFVGAVANQIAHAQWALLGVAAGSALVSWVIVLLAVRRPAAGDPKVDLALRSRSARVAIGLGIGMCAVAGGPVENFGSFLAFVVALAVFIAIVSPPRQLPPVAARVE